MAHPSPGPNASPPPLPRGPRTHSSGESPILCNKNIPDHFFGPQTFCPPPPPSARSPALKPCSHTPFTPSHLLACRACPFPFTASDLKLSAPAAFFLMTSRIPRYQARLQCWLLKLRFPGLIDTVQEELTLLRDVSTQLRSSQPFRRVLRAILDLGNVLNAGARLGGAMGFRMGDLRKLKDLKSADGQVSPGHHWHGVWEVEGVQPLGRPLSLWLVWPLSLAVPLTCPARALGLCSNDV